MLLSLTSAFTLWSKRHTTGAPFASSPRVRSLLRATWATALFTLGVLCLRRLATLGDLRAAWSTSVGIGTPLLVLFALPCVSHFVKMLGWRALLPRSARPPLAEAYATFVAAQGVNELGFSVLGEPLKILVLAPGARADGIRAVVSDNLAALVALGAVVITLLEPRLVAVPLALGWLGVLHASPERVRSLLKAFAAHYLGKLWLVVEIALGLYLLDEATLAPAPRLALAWLGAAALGSPVPGQLGVVEAALVHTGVALGVALPSLLALALIRRVRGLLWLALGLFLATRLVHRTRIRETDVSTTTA